MTAFDISAAQRELQDVFVPEILTEPQNTSYWPATVAPKYRDAIIQQLIAYAKSKHGRDLGFAEIAFIPKQTEIGYQHWITDKFNLSSVLTVAKKIPDYEHELICEYVQQGAQKQAQTLSDVIKTVKVGPTVWRKEYEGQHLTHFEILAVIWPVPENFEKYLPVVDLYVESKNWFLNAYNARVNELQKKFETLVDASRPNNS